MIEIWKNIVNYEGLYQISNYGNVRNKKNLVMKTTLDGKGYYKINLCKSGIKKSFRIHKLLALYFIENPENKEEVNHIDGNKQNNDIKNLEWVTKYENRMHYEKIIRNVRRGVYFHKKNKTYIAQICYRLNKQKIQKNLGSFINKEDAYQAFFNEFVKHHGKTPW